MDHVPVKVSIREFRSRLARYADTSSPIAITRHGATVGYYIPARPSPDKAELDALKEAASRLDALLAQAGVSEEEMLSEFRQLRNNRA
ncbi:MAG: type II toxin-antitoxin system Phd/YefM family antitoxin [Nitrospira sp. SB0677_bin_15]|nr:type II toxin-antitoxin system Phd/YefM family antitoxin [Nitrospira sp. SB0661_bin_20]MYG41008.1 type II toxin-antitoxin system Phd/YefM family antitoxin [Nitrospira sp. SB0677_bin_15]MYJ22776.1 type II toxin-antitoxin system Phd/YefM family antitoxin [Nitrospira sp. SB0673_bin_12]